MLFRRGRNGVSQKDGTLGGGLLADPEEDDSLEGGRRCIDEGWRPRTAQWKGSMQGCCFEGRRNGVSQKDGTLGGGLLADPEEDDSLEGRRRCIEEGWRPRVAQWKGRMHRTSGAHSRKVSDEDGSRGRRSSCRKWFTD